MDLGYRRWCVSYCLAIGVIVEDKCEVDAESKDRRRRERPATSWGTIASIVGIALSVIGSYVTLQTDIATLKRGEYYQEQTNARLAQEIRSNKGEINEVRAEQRGMLREFGDKVDRLMTAWENRRR